MIGLNPFHREGTAVVFLTGGSMKRNVFALDSRRESETALAVSKVTAEFNGKFLTVAEAATEATVSINTIRRGYESGHLTVQRIGVGGRIVRIRRGDLGTWLAGGGRTRP